MSIHHRSNMSISIMSISGKILEPIRLTMLQSRTFTVDPLVLLHARTSTPFRVHIDIDVNGAAAIRKLIRRCQSIAQY